jgi:hypothetical protein
VGRGEGEVDVRDVDLGLELHNAAYAAWGFATELASACETNPELCRAGANLVNAAATSAQGLAVEVRDRWQNAAEKPVEVAEAGPAGPKKIQARVE